MYKKIFLIMLATVGQVRAMKKIDPSLFMGVEWSSGLQAKGDAPVYTLDSTPSGYKRQSQEEQNTAWELLIQEAHSSFSQSEQDKKEKLCDTILQQAINFTLQPVELTKPMLMARLVHMAVFAKCYPDKQGVVEIWEHLATCKAKIDALNTPVLSHDDLAFIEGFSKKVMVSDATEFYLGSTCCRESMSIGLDCAQCGATVKGKLSDSLQHIVLGLHHFGGRVGTDEKTTLLKWAFLHKRALSAPQLSAAPRNRLKKSGQYGTCGPDALILEGKK